MSTTTAVDEAADRPDGAERHHDIGGIHVAAVTKNAALATVRAAIGAERHLKLAFCNANLVNLSWTDPALRHELRRFLILPDGIGVDIAARLLRGEQFPANLNGTDFIPALLASEPRRLRVMLLGARPGVAERAAERLGTAYPQHRFEVLSHGFFTAGEEPHLLARLEQERPDLLLVALGNPRQERWIAQLEPRHAIVAAGVGALLDFLGGEVTRAPALVRRLRLEWLYRLALEPRRLWRRYVLGNPLFLARMLGLRLGGHPPR